MNNKSKKLHSHDINFNDPYELAKFIKKADKTTPIKAYLKGSFDNISFKSYDLKDFGEGSLRIVIGEYDKLNSFLTDNPESIIDYYIESDRRNSAIPLLDIKGIHARIEPGSIIRDRVVIGKNAVIMMGAILNIGAVIGENTMIDMNAVVGARAIIGKNCHIGAGAVVAGVLEPPSNTPVIIEDDVLIGANAVLLEGVKVEKGAVVAAGSIVTRNVPPDTVVAGIPAKVIKKKDQQTIDKVKIIEDLRG